MSQKATIITTSDGKALVKFTDGSVVSADTVEDVKNLLPPKFSEIAVKNYNSSFENIVSSHEEKYAEAIAKRNQGSPQSQNAGYGAKLQAGTQGRSLAYTSGKITTSNGYTVNDYSDRYKIISGNEARAMGFGTSGDHVIYDPLNNSIKSSYKSNELDRAKFVLSDYNSAPETVQLDKIGSNNYSRSAFTDAFKFAPIKRYMELDYQEKNKDTFAYYKQLSDAKLARLQGSSVQAQQPQQQTQQNYAVAQPTLPQAITPTASGVTGNVGYEMPEGYQGSGYMPQFGSTQPGQVPMTGTFTKPATVSMIGGQTTPSISGLNTGTASTQTTAANQYEVKQYRNASGMTTSITFIDGAPQTPIPSGFYPAETAVDPTAMGMAQPPQAQAYTTPQVQVPQMTQQPQAQDYTTPQVQVPQMAEGGVVPAMFAEQKRSRYVPNSPSVDYSNFENVSYEQAGFTAPDPSKPSAQAFENYYNPTTKQRVSVPSSGYTPAEGFIRAGTESYTSPPQEIGSRPRRAIEDIPGFSRAQFINQEFDQRTASQSRNAPLPQQETVPLEQYDPRVLNQQYIPQQPDFTGQNITEVQAGLAKTPGLPTGATVVPTGTQITADQLVSPYSGQVTGSLALPTSLAATEQAMMPVEGQANLVSPIEASGAVSAAVDRTQAAQLDQVSAIEAAQQEGTSVSDLSAAQGTAILMDNPVERKIQDGELISAAANAETAAKFNEEIQAATATPTAQATVQGQLEGLMQQFEGGKTPAWAAGSMRNAMATLSARGLGASSMAGQAVIQAAMESALPIAQTDAEIQARFEERNLSNRQERAMLAAEQRATFLGQEFDQEYQSRVANAAKISDIANTNFTAEQQIALENSRIANTMELTNLSNSQAMVLAEASAIANMDLSNLNNRQQAGVQNAQNFLQADLSNLSNQQQTELFKAQQRVQSLFTDQAALNAAQQFNASSENQVSQFFASLLNNTSQFNASQANAQGQFNAGQVNVIERFNAEINNQRDQFNAQNRLIIDQSNAQWRREIATADTAAVNRANEVNAQSLLGYSQQAYNNLWQYYADNMEWAWTSAENERQRYMNLTVAKMQQDTSLSLAKAKEDYESSSGFGELIGKVLTSDMSNTMLSGIFG